MNGNEPPTEYECASVGQRIFARLADVALVVAFLFGAGSIPAMNLEVMYFLILAILAAAYYFFCDGLFAGQGIGKRLVGIRVVDARTRKPCSVGQAGLRVVVQFIPLMPMIETVYLAIDCVQRFGDRVAGTYVLRVHPRPRPVENLRPIDYSRLGQTLKAPAPPAQDDRDA